MSAPLVITVPMALPSLSNDHTHWRNRARTVKAQRHAVAVHMLAHRDEVPALPLTVTLTRVSPRELVTADLSGLAQREATR